MMESRAHTTWEGDLMSGSGRTSLASGAAGPLAVTWSSRTQASEGRTSPEELIAAAHATCFSMALSHGLTEAGTLPGRLDTEAIVTFEQTDAGFRVTKSALIVQADVPGISEDDFQTAARAAKEGCPVSQALKGNVEITLEAILTTS
jgi:osmotically inducible protein OsmC